MLWALLVAAGCATQEVRVDYVPVVSRRVAALPAEGAVLDYDLLGGSPTPNPTDTVTAKKYLDDAINYRLRQHQGRAFDAAAIDGLPHAYPFHIWVKASLNEIRDWSLGRAKETHETVADWKFSSSLGAWRTALDADFILVSLFNYGRNPPYVSPAFLVGGVPALATEVAIRTARTDTDVIACVVHLETSRVVWCNVKCMKGDVTLREGAQTDVDALLEEMLRAGDGAPAEPPPTGTLTARATPAPDPGPVPPHRPDPKLHRP